MRFIVVLSCIFAAASQITHAQGPPTAPWALEPESATPINVSADIRHLVGPDLEYEEGEAIKGVAVDLNGDGIEDYLLQSAPSLCGNGGCIYVLRDGAARRKIGEFFDGPPVRDAAPGADLAAAPMMTDDGRMDRVRPGSAVQQCGRESRTVR